MNELIIAPETFATIRRHFLITASAFALTAYIASADFAKAEDVERSTVWVELGGQMELMQGASSTLTAPFMFITPTPGSYKPDNLIETQQPPRDAFGLQGKVTFQPEGSDWIFAAALRYGRAHTNRHVHHQTAVYYSYASAQHQKYVAEFSDTKLHFEESHTVLDFSAGHDVGLGIFGKSGTSVISAGVRFAQFSARSSLDIHARPIVNLAQISGVDVLPSFYQHTLAAHAERSFRGIGPSLSWDASATLLGNSDHARLTVDWGINAALLFGRQKAKADHRTAEYHYNTLFDVSHYTQVYPPKGGSADRSRSVVLPNLGGFAGLSVKYPNAKVSFGYRADFFFGAVDAGFDTRHTQALGFHGPFATVSIGLGG